jgi:hypothetical protein
LGACRCQREIADAPLAALIDLDNEGKAIPKVDRTPEIKPVVALNIDAGPTKARSEGHAHRKPSTK